jgi:Tol biopolymer transport system component
MLMRDDLDLRIIDRRHDPDPRFVAELEAKLEAIVADVTEASTPVRATEDATVIDLVSASETDERRKRPKRVIVPGLSIAAALLLVAAAVVLVQRLSNSSHVVTTPTPDITTAEVTTTTNANGWVAFIAGYPDGDVYIVREGSPAHRIAGSDGDAINQACPAFSPDGTRLAFGQAAGSDADGSHEAGIVLAELTADGEVSATTMIALDADQTATADEGARPPCAIWSADGRWLAFGAGTYQNHVDPQIVDAVWVADTETDDIRRLPELARVTDIEWAPNASELYAASGGAIKVYSVATNETRELADRSWGVEYLAVSPDGHSIATQGRRQVETDANGLSPTSRDLRLMDLQGTGESKQLVDRGVISQGFEKYHGDGPVWSPDGARIAFQRACDFTPDSQTCGEQNEVVVVTVNDNRPEDPSGLPPLLNMPQVVVPPPDLTAPDGIRRWWWPFYVTWSPDSTTLLYAAWGEPLDERATDDYTNAILAVRVDGATPPAILAETDVRPYGGVLKLHLQSWNRQQG